MLSISHVSALHMTATTRIVTKRRMSTAPLQRTISTKLVRNSCLIFWAVVCNLASSVYKISIAIWMLQLWCLISYPKQGDWHRFNPSKDPALVIAQLSEYQLANSITKLDQDSGGVLII